MITESQIDAHVAAMFRDIEFTREPAGLYDPLRYMIEIGGKHLRPRLCLTTYSFFDDSFGDEILSPAAALEVFHSFTLMHDDIMDRSPLRRGMPTVWKKWNESTAILSGDVMLIDAYQRIAKAPSKVLQKVMDLFFRTTVEVCEGQQYDMDFENQEVVSMTDYNKMIGLKTAVLIACAAKTGALIGGASDKICDALYNYGYELGMAFQVADDYLDAFGDEKVFGKPIGGDIVNSKKSWLTVRAREQQEELADCAGAGEERRHEGLPRRLRPACGDGCPESRQNRHREAALHNPRSRQRRQGRGAAFHRQGHGRGQRFRPERRTARNAAELRRQACRQSPIAMAQAAGKTVMAEATVVKNAGSHFLLSRLPEWELFPAVLRGRVRLEHSSSTNPVAVGDRVRCTVGELLDETHPAVITEVLPRRNYLIRRSTNLSRQTSTRCW